MKQINATGIEYVEYVSVLHFVHLFWRLCVFSVILRLFVIDSVFIGPFGFILCLFSSPFSCAWLLRVSFLVIFWLLKVS